MQKLFLTALFFLLAGSLSAQAVPDTINLPNLRIESVLARHLIRWHNQYDGVRSITVQRSTDSIRNFTTLAIITNPKKGPGQYVDEHPVLGKNYYRLSIMFNGDLEWFSNKTFQTLDSATLAKAIEEKKKQDELMKTRLTQASTTNTSGSESPAVQTTPPATSANTIENQEFYYTPSSKIYTNPYTGHINIQLEDVSNHRYTIRFFDAGKQEVLKIGRVSKSLLILDKNNFNTRGLYRFDLYDGNSLLESGFVTIY